LSFGLALLQDLGFLIDHVIFKHTVVDVDSMEFMRGVGRSEHVNHRGVCLGLIGRSEVAVNFHRLLLIVRVVEQEFVQLPQPKMRHGGK
jgi:hypothetical protein